MPFVSEKQRKYMWWLKSNPKARKSAGLKRQEVNKMTAHDTGGKLPEVAETRRAVKGR